MSRRGNGEGTIYQRADGRWAGLLNVGYEGGKRKRAQVLGRTRKEVQVKLDEARRNIHDGLPAAPSNQTLGQYLASWLEDTVKPSVRPKTFESYSQAVRKHVIPDLGRIKLASLTPQHVQALLNRKLKAGLSARSVQNIRRVLTIALGVAEKWGMLSRNAAALTDPPRLEHAEMRALTPGEARKFLDALDGHRLEALFSVAVALGLRLGEALGLSWHDVDLDAGAIHVRRQLQTVDGHTILTEPKTNKSRRQIALPPGLVQKLRDRQEHQKTERTLAGETWKDTGLVFTSLVGTPLQTNRVRHIMWSALKRAGLPRIRFHDLRHTCASLLAAQNVHPKVVQEILGHSNIAITLDLYSHIFSEAKHEAAATMNAVLWPSG